MIFKKTFLLLTVLCLTSQLMSVSAEDSFMTLWNRAIFQAAAQSGTDLLRSLRLAYIAHNAMYNAWAHYDDKAISDPIIGFSRQAKDLRTLANKETAMSYAAYYTMKALLPNQVSILNELMATLGYSVTPAPTNPTTPAGIGARAAKIMLVTRRDDNSNQLGNLNPSGVPYDEPTLLPDYKPYKSINTVDRLKNINYWQPQKNADGTAQTFQAPYWGVVEPFAMSAGNQFRPKKGPKRTCSDLAGFKKQAKQIYKISENLTPEQRFIAIYWDGQVFVDTSIYHDIAAAIAKRDKYGLDQEIKINFATSAALLDAGIACWDTKRVYNSVRPITVIHKLIDWKWTPLLSTPPHPDYTAAHSVTTAAVAEIFRKITGSDKYGNSYTDKTTGIKLSWKTFTDMVDQVSQSRMYGGIHFEDAVKVGEIQGTKVGKVVWKKLKGLFGGY